MSRKKIRTIASLAFLLAAGGCMVIPELTPGTNVLCGDRQINNPIGEECDDGGNSPGCDADCTAASCGDEFVNPAAGEQCDPPSQTCSKSCLRINCGDGIKDPGEDCDDGGFITSTCDNDCTFPACGDGIYNGWADEFCDAGGQDTATCDGDCTLPWCGDGRLNPAANEECDTGGNSLDCDQDCTLALCGDQFVNPMRRETCDDGNLANTDECTTVCAPPNCTDGLESADEIDVDCGGHCGPHSCQMLQSCSSREDCTEGLCLGGTCVPDWSRLVTGGWHSCALLDTGRVRCWGYGRSGQLGYGNTAHIGDDETPDSAGDVEVDGNVIQLAAGWDHTCTLLDTGHVRCWGNGSSGQLGYGNTMHIGDDEAPASAGNVEIDGNVIQLAAGGSHTCALLGTGDVQCWGSGNAGRLGYRNTRNVGDNELPASAGVVNVGGKVIQLTAGWDHTCALLDTGRVRCWGSGRGGQLGYGNIDNIGDNEAPASAGDVEIGGKVIQIAAGGSHTCALLDNGDVRCWGSGIGGPLGYGNNGNIGDNETPASAGDVEIGGKVTQIAAGGSHTCALLDNGDVRCWGDGFGGQLGYGNTDSIGDDEVPSSVSVVDVSRSVTQIAAGDRHTCVRLDSGAVRCWGYGFFGQLGYGNTSNIGDDEAPSSVGDVDVDGSVTQLNADVEHFAACST